jgi:purine catabolism regulator
MSSFTSSSSSVSVRNILALLASRDAHLVAGAGGLERRVTWACRMRARLPAFESVQGGELALLTLAQLRRLGETLPQLLKSLYRAGIAAVAVAASSTEVLGEEAITLANQLNVPLILLPPAALLEEIEREVITFVVNYRGEVERKATEIFQQLMQMSAHGAGIKGICEHLANVREKWVLVQDADQQVRLQAAPPSELPLTLPTPLTDEWLRRHKLACIVEPIALRHEVVGTLALIGHEGDFDYLERIILSQVVPILAIEFARERERSEVESRYQVEAFTDVLQGNYQSADEMIARARILGYDLSTPQVVAVFETTLADGEEKLFTQWSRRIRDELLRVWPSCWLLPDMRRVVALLPVAAMENGEGDERAYEQAVYTRLERVHARLQQGRNPIATVGIGRVAKQLQDIPKSSREAQQALEIGQRLFGVGTINSFARLGVYRLLFHLDGHQELTDFYYETLGPLLDHDARNDGPLIETLEGFFRCNGNLSETARTMHLHRNSLLYRLGRIEELLGRSLEDPELRLSLQIALKIRHLHRQN